MKRFFILLTCAATLNACDLDSDSVDQDTVYQEIGEVIFLGALSQFYYNIDPFDVAFRLNTLIIEAQNAGESLDEINNSEFKTQLLGTSTTITKEGGSYTLKLATVDPDNTRSGTVVIATGDATLSEGNSWALSFPESDIYTVSIEGIISTITASQYTITAEADNQWNVYLSGFVSKTPDDGTSGNTAGSNWTGTMTVVQVDNPGDQTINGVSTSSYTVNISNSSNVTTAYFLDPITVRTPTPLTIYTPSCGEIISNGSLIVSLVETDDILDFASGSWTTESGSCTPTTSLTYHGVEIPISVW